MTHNNKIIAWAKETGKKLRLSTHDMTGEEGWMPLVCADNDAGAMNKDKNEEQTFGAEMTPIEQAIRDFDKHARAVESLIKGFKVIAEPAPESMLCDTVFGLLTAYRKTIEDQHGIDDDWLEWWRLECRLGETPLEAGLAGEEMRTIATIDDLVAIVIGHIERLNGA